MASNLPSLESEDGYYDNALSVFKVSDGAVRRMERNVIVQDGQIHPDFVPGSAIMSRIKEGQVGGIYRFGGSHEKWGADQWDGRDETKPKFHVLDALNPELVYKADERGLPVPMIDEDADGNIYLLDPAMPGGLRGPLATGPGTYYFDGDASFERVLGPDDPDQAILLLSRGQKPTIKGTADGEISFTYKSNNQGEEEEEEEQDGEFEEENESWSLFRWLFG